MSNVADHKEKMEVLIKLSFPVINGRTFVSAYMKARWVLSITLRKIILGCPEGLDAFVSACMIAGWALFVMMIWLLLLFDKPLSWPLEDITLVFGVVFVMAFGACLGGDNSFNLFRDLSEYIKRKDENRARKLIGLDEI